MSENKCRICGATTDLRASGTEYVCADVVWCDHNRKQKYPSRPITFDLALVAEVKNEREHVQTVDIITDMKQTCSRCKTVVIGDPLGLSMVDVVDSSEMNKARWAVATALYNAMWEADERSYSRRKFDELQYHEQAPWLSATGADGWYLKSYLLENVGVGLSETVRKAGVEEAKKWPAFTDRRKVFRVTQAQFPVGWVHLSFSAHSSKTGEPVEHANVMVHICPKCAPAIFDAANVDPTEPFKDGVKW